MHSCRLQDIRKPGSVNQDPIFSNNKLPDGEVGYPGGIFDPLGYSKGDLQTLKLKEIKNARLAMLGFAGFVAQVGGVAVHRGTHKCVHTHWCSQESDSACNILTASGGGRCTGIMMSLMRSELQ